LALEQIYSTGILTISETQIPEAQRTEICYFNLPAGQAG
jgi:hypothetical protein